ncbi:barstar family protein [Actinacidiphila alni]|uniref:barstar family protein n=1 Tax=Actinacidiphila alni TaxID=380248 RepID=UPI0034538293
MTTAPDGTLVLDLTGVGDRQTFMDRCTERLHLPDWFGRNWDALADCLTDLSWWPTGPAGRELRVTGWQEYAAAKPREWRIVKDVLRDAETFWRDTDTELRVLVADADPAEPSSEEAGLEEDTNDSPEDRDVRP